MENVSIKEASEKDIPIILGLLYDLERPKPKTDSEVDSFRNLVKKYLKDSDKKILIAVVNDVKIIGMISIVFLSRLNHDSLELYVPEIIVLEKYRKHGIGKKLVDFCIALGKEKNCHRIRLESGYQRKDSHQFYRSLGFEQSALSFSKNLK